ncbi:hypothetical protein F5B18DRAFT_637580 [Nemania serpens]|nr:hypothetical protein F5B18DRAFT_637580 [Nemania serpens]
MSNSQVQHNGASPLSGGGGGGEHSTGDHSSNSLLSSSSNSNNNDTSNSTNNNNTNISASSSIVGHPNLAPIAHTISTVPALFPTMYPGFHPTPPPYYTAASQADALVLAGAASLGLSGNIQDSLDALITQARNAELVVCVVCGGICKSMNPIPDAVFDQDIPAWMRPALLRAKSEYLEWQKQNPSARSLNSSSAALIQLIKVTFFLGGSQGMREGRRTLHIDTADPLMRIPIHMTCFEIAQRFCKVQARYGIDFRSPLGGTPSSISHLYEIWCKRAMASCPQGRMTRTILEANNYFGAPLCSPVPKYLETIRKDPSLSRFFAYPLDIPNLTDMVVNTNIQTMDGKRTSPSAGLAKLWRRCQDLPQELFDNVISLLEPFDENGGPPLQPTRVLPPTWWKTKLLSGELIPWLWDLNKNVIVRRRIDTYYKDYPGDVVRDQDEGRYVFDEDMWDWELLCRQLAQANVVEEGGLLEGQPYELWNRHRIWKLLDVARLGHVAFSA